MALLFIIFPVLTLLEYAFFSQLTVYKKHYPPALDDDVWRLEKIGKDGSFHKRLNNQGIFKVEDFLRLAVKDSQKLRNVSETETRLLNYEFYALYLPSNIESCWM